MGARRRYVGQTEIDLTWPTAAAWAPTLPSAAAVVALTLLNVSAASRPDRGRFGPGTPAPIGE